MSLPAELGGDLGDAGAFGPLQHRDQGFLLAAFALAAGGGRNCGFIGFRVVGGLDTEGSITAHLEETGGYLPLRRVGIGGGSASFKVGALGLEVGDSFRIKAGFRYFPGAADVVCTVV